MVRFLIILAKVFLPLVAQSIRCYKFKASATQDEYDTEKFIPKKFLIQENLQQCEKGVTHCIMMKGIIKNYFHTLSTKRFGDFSSELTSCRIYVIKNIMRHLFFRFG